MSELISEGETVERYNEYKYLGTRLDNKLTFECNTNNIVKKCHRRIFCMFRFCSFNESVLTSYLVCWFGTLGVKNRDKLNSIVNRGSIVVE